ncbi:MAG TPA: glycosyltransferase family 2 protein [Vicinamibacterales bacterium]|nr:glycosyltransferase family 2 protein [Vicinamibacterales bacterium]
MRRAAILVPTHNRAGSLRRTLSSLVAQSHPATDIELIVIDNNCTDDTAAVCARFSPRVRRIVEERQGLSHARNAGIAALQHFTGDDIVVFIDDDVEATAEWIGALVDAFERHPEVDGAGGRVLPSNPAALPSWITRRHWAPLALQDHGDDALVFESGRPVGLVGANFAFRKRVFDRIGGFSPDVQRVKDGIGSTEDHEFLQRLYAAGGRALYVPSAVVTTEVPQTRMTRAYHRRWHRGHGRFHAVMRTPELERSKLRVLGVPLHLVRRALADVVAWVRSLLVGDSARAFAAETRLWFFSGFLKERCACVGRR